MTGPATDDPRTADLAQRLTALRARITAAAEAAGRDPAGLTLVAVTKTYPAADVLRLTRLGVTDIGENRDQEAAPKAAEVGAHGVHPCWHFVGRLQRNKCRSVVRYAGLVHSVDRVGLVRALAAAAADREQPLPVLMQVSVDGDPSRGGVSAADLPELADAVVAQESLRLRGVMAVAPLGWRPERAFGELAGIAERLRADHPDATIVSAGMSGDLEEAVRCGATHLRVGSALLGKRDPLR